MTRQLTHVFNNGNSQAVRIPQAFRIAATEVEISRDENGNLILHPLIPQRGDALLALLAQFTDAAFLAELEQNQREQAPMQERLPLCRADISGTRI
jgi:antitoxin VapB